MTQTHTLGKCVLSTTTLLANLTGQGWPMDPSIHTADTTQTGFSQTLGLRSLKMTAHNPETHPESWVLHWPEHWITSPNLSMRACSLSCVRLFATPRTVARQAPLPVGFPKQEYWSGLPCPLPGDLPNQGIELRPPALQADSLPSEPPGKPPWDESS